MQSTIALFRHLYNTLPPLFPSDTKQRMEHALSHLEVDQTVTLEEIEDTMVKFGFEVWPYNQAFREFFVFTEANMGEHFLLPKLSVGLQQHYHDFKAYGGTLRDLHSGRPASFFSSEERVELCGALVDMQTELREYAARQIMSLEKDKYLSRVKEFAAILAEIKVTLGRLNGLADAEQEHPTLAHEIRAQVAAFEHGLCLLAPELDYDAVCNSVEFFKGRKHDLNRMKGSNVPLNIDFYTEKLR